MNLLRLAKTKYCLRKPQPTEEWNPEDSHEEIRNLQKKKTLSDRERARLHLLQENKTSWEKSIYKINTIRNYNGTVKLESHCRKTWRGLTGWKRYGYVKNHNKRQAEIYKSYLIHKGCWFVRHMLHRT